MWMTNNQCIATKYVYCTVTNKINSEFSTEILRVITSTSQLCADKYKHDSLLHEYKINDVFLEVL